MSKFTDLIDSKGRPKVAPVQGYAPGIPWSLHLEAYDAYRKQWGGQEAMIDLEGKGCRGGFSTRELDGFIPGWRDKVSEIANLRAEVETLRAALAQHVASVELLPLGFVPGYVGARLKAGDTAVMATITAQPLPAHGVTTAIYMVPPVQPAIDHGGPLIAAEDQKALMRFAECAEDSDSGGHDVSRDRMARLCEIGVMQTKGFGRHQITSFGDHVLSRAAGELSTLPLQTCADRCPAT